MRARHQSRRWFRELELGDDEEATTAYRRRFSPHHCCPHQITRKRHSSQQVIKNKVGPLYLNEELGNAFEASR